MCDNCQSIIASLKAANADKDKIIRHLSRELHEAEQVNKAMRHVFNKLSDRGVA